MTRKKAGARVSLTVLTQPDSARLSQGKRVVQGMRQYAELFPDPPINLDEFDTLLNSYSDAIAACLNASKMATATRNGIGEAVDKALRQLANYVNLVADGDKATIGLAGFDTWTYSRSQPQPAAKPSIAKGGAGKIRGVLRNPQH